MLITEFQISFGRSIDQEPESADHHRVATPIADALGWSPTTVADAEGGRRRLDIGQITALCRALDVPLANLLDGADEADLRALGIQA